MKLAKSETLFAEAQGLMPGGVNSPVRSFRAVGGAGVGPRPSVGGGRKESGYALEGTF